MPKSGDRALTTLIVNRLDGAHGIMDMHHTIAEGLEVRRAHDVHELGLYVGLAGEGFARV